jgi:hypothetical protein
VYLRSATFFNQPAWILLGASQQISVAVQKAELLSYDFETILRFAGVLKQ